MIFIIGFKVWLALALLPALCRGWATRRRIRKAAKNAPDNEKWTYDIILG